MNGFITHALASRPLPKANGIVLLVQPIWPVVKGENKKINLKKDQKADTLTHCASFIDFSSLLLSLEVTVA